MGASSVAGRRSSLGAPTVVTAGPVAYRLPDPGPPGLATKSPKPGLPSGAAEAPLPAGVLLAGGPQVPAVEVRPESVEEDQLGVGRLPQQEVARAVLPGAAHEQVDVGHARLVEEARDRVLVDLVG